MYWAMLKCLSVAFCLEVKRIYDLHYEKSYTVFNAMLFSELLGLPKLIHFMYAG